MKKSLWKLIVFIILSVLLIGIVILIINDNNNRIPTNYIAIFKGGSGEVTYSTYIYKLDNKSEDYGYSFINTTNRTTSYGSSKWTHKITSKGETSWKDQLFEVAKSNHAYSSVEYEGKSYTVDKFAKIFLPQQPEALEEE